jgi:hypothetical protein
MWDGSFDFLMTLGFGYLRKSETKEPLVPGISKPSKNHWVS